MSVVICYVCNSFSMIATDTRISYDLSGTLFTDDNIKLRSTIKDSSWAAGVGLESLIDEFVRVINEANINSIDDRQIQRYYHGGTNQV